MNSPFDDLLVAFETHSVERIRAILNAGFDVGSAVNGKTPAAHLIEMYFRSDRFPECLRLLLEHGATLDDPKLEPVLLNDPVALEAAVRNDRTLLAHSGFERIHAARWSDAATCRRRVRPSGGGGETA
jgi:hypothetical protein